MRRWRQRLREFAFWLTAKLWPNAALIYSVEFIDEAGRPNEVTTNLHRARCLRLEGKVNGKRVLIARYTRTGYVRAGDLR